jgi:hypothetical protein
MTVPDVARSSSPVPGPLLEESLEDLYENAPCGYPSLLPNGLMIKVNQTFLGWTGHSGDEVVS